MTSRKIRHQFCLEEDASAKLEQLCRKASVTKSELVGRAVEAFIEGRLDGEADKRYAQRLNRISRNLSRVRTGRLRAFDTGDNLKMQKKEARFSGRAYS